MIIWILAAAAITWAAVRWHRRQHWPTAGAGASAARHARALSTPAVRLAGLLGIHTQAGDRARRFAHAAKTERRTGKLLDTLRAEGWSVLHDRYLRGKNVDHILIGPHGDTTVGDTKGWDPRLPVTVRNGRLYHGNQNVTDRLNGLHWEARETSRLLGGIPVRKMVFMDGPTLRGPAGQPAAELSLDGIRIIPADQAPAVLRRTAHIHGKRTRDELAALAEHVLPPHARE